MIEIAFSYVIYAAAYAIVAISTVGAAYIAAQALSVPYQNKTDRIWKGGDDDDEETSEVPK